MILQRIITKQGDVIDLVREGENYLVVINNEYDQIFPTINEAINYLNVLASYYVPQKTIIFSK